MLRIMTVVGTLALSACSVFGVRSGTEEPRYEVVERVDEALEVRRYGARIAAATTVSGTGGQATGQGFRRLAGYIGGANREQRSIAMTAPVETAAPGRKIAMTAPVQLDRAAEGAGQLTMRFFLPAEIATVAAAPSPTDPSVTLEAVAPQTLAVLRFTGMGGEATVVRRQAELLERLAATAWQATGQPAAFFYDPPWTLPFLRRNEVAVAVSPR